MADKLSKLSGKDFDKEYISDMVDDHEKDVKEFEKASKDAKDPDLKAWAGEDAADAAGSPEDDHGHRSLWPEGNFIFV